MDLRAVAGVPESALDERVAADLPTAAPAAPWTCRCDALVWSTWAYRAVRRSAGPIGRPSGVLGALVSYSDSPVGPYREVLGMHLAQNRYRVTVPFIAVDSPASLVGGRLNGALPKTLAEFTGEPAARTMAATGAGWTVSVTARVFGPPLPMVLMGRLEQPWPDGRRRTVRVRGRATSRLALVRVSVRSSGSLARWLRPGWHLGVLLRRVEIRIAAPIRG